MKKIELTLGERVFTAKFGIAFIGTYLKANNQTVEEMLEDFKTNPFLTAPTLMYYSFKNADPSMELSLDDVFDLIDTDGGITSPQLNKFIEAFGASLSVNVPQDEKVGKSKAKVKR